jgi:hypothetical protein
MTDLFFPMLCHILAFICAFMAGWHWRDRRCQRTIAAMGEMNRRNVAEANRRGFRDGVCSQMQVETANLNRR